MVSMLLEIWSWLFIPDPDPDYSPIPDPGVKKAPDPDPQHCLLGINTKYECLQERKSKRLQKTTAENAVKILPYILRSMLCQLWSCGLQQNQVHQEG